MKQKITAKAAISGALWRFGERICAQLVTFIVSLILARLLLPEDYGIVSIAMILIYICNVFAASGFGVALIQKKEADNLDYSTISIFGLLMTGMLYTLLFFAAPLIAAIYQKAELTLLLRIMALRLPFTAINSVQQAYVSRHLIFKKFFFSTLIGTCVSAVVGIWMAYCGCGVWSLAAQYLVNGVMDTIILGITLHWWPGIKFSLIRLKGMFGFGWRILFSDLLVTLYTQVRGLLIGKFYAPDQLAYFERGQQIPHIFVTNVGTAISSVLFPAMSAQQDDHEAFTSTLRRSVRFSAYIMFPIMGGLAVIAEPLIKLLLTDKWLPAVPFLQLSCLAFAFSSWGTINQQATKALGKSEQYLQFEIQKRIVGVLLLVISLPFGVTAIALSACLEAFFALVINAHLNHALDYGFVRQAKDVGPTVCITLVMMLLVAGLRLIVADHLLLLLLQIAAGILLYIILSVLTRHDGFIFAKSVLFNLLGKRKGLP